MSLRTGKEIFIKDFKKGIVLYSDSDFTPAELKVGELFLCQNAYWRNGLQKRKGMAKVSASKPNGANSIKAMHRFYRKSNPNQLLAASFDQIFTLNETTGAWTSIKGSLSDVSVFFTQWSPTEKVFIANGSNTPQVWDGSAIIDYTAAPVNTKQFIIHRERVFAYAAGLTFSYSDNLDPDTFSAASLTLASNDPTITGMAIHTQSTSDSSVLSQLAIFTANTTWVLAGNDFVNLTDVFLQEIDGQVGTQSPNTIIRTPAGVIFLGRQQGRNNVFLISGEGLGARVIAIGDNIRQELAKLPASGLDEATAIYFDGYYRLSFRPPGGIQNTREYWLKIDNITNDGAVWFGAMSRSIGMRSLMSLSGAGDNNKIYGGGEDGFLYQMDTDLSDDGTVIDVKIQTGFYDLDQPARIKRIQRIITDIQGSGGIVTIVLNYDLAATADENSKTFTMTTTGSSFPYTFPFTFFTTGINTDISDFSGIDKQGIRVSFRIEFSELNDDFLLNMLGWEYSIEEDYKK